MNNRERVLGLGPLYSRKLEEFHARTAEMIERGKAGEDIEAEMQALVVLGEEVRTMIKEYNRLLPQTLD